MILQSVHYINEKNTGDMQSCPFEHFTVAGSELRKFHITNVEKLDPNLPVIIGGGGLFQHGPSINNIEAIINNHKAPVIIWGAGVNNNGYKANDFIPDFIQKASLVGIRDYGFLGFELLPCVSCMHPAFDKKYDVKHDVVCFEGNKLDLPYPTMHCQQGATMDQIIEFLGSAKTIVTSSYHGMYWGVLLGRQVIAIPNADSSKFYHFPLNVPMAKMDNWQFFLGKCEEHTNSLEKCRNANKSFANRVSKLLNIDFKAI